MAKLLLLIAILGLMFSNCLFPKDCKVTINMFEFGMWYKFECNYDDAMGYIEELNLNKPEVFNGEYYDLGNCDVGISFISKKRNVHISLIQKCAGGISRSGGNPIIIPCTKTHWNKIEGTLKKNLGSKLSAKNTSVSFTIEEL
jgi:hypothetical protein